MKLTKNESSKIRDKIYNFETKYKEGFTPDEHQQIIDWLKDNYPKINMDKYHEAQYGDTCGIVSTSQENGNWFKQIFKKNSTVQTVLRYHCDILKAAICSIENRSLTVEEWD